MPKLGIEHQNAFTSTVLSNLLTSCSILTVDGSAVDLRCQTVSTGCPRIRPHWDGEGRSPEDKDRIASNLGHGDGSKGRECSEI